MEPVPFNPQPMEFTAWVIAAVLTFTAGLVATILHAEKQRGLRHADSETARDKLHIAAVEKNTAAMLRVSTRQAELIERLNNHIEDDEKQDAAVAATLDSLDRRLDRLEGKP